MVKMLLWSSHFVFEDEGVEMTQEIKDLFLHLKVKAQVPLFI